MTVRPAKTQISLGICPVWSESSLCAHWLAKDLSFLHADSEDSDQTGRIFAGRTCDFLGFAMRRLILKEKFWKIVPELSEKLSCYFRIYRHDQLSYLVETATEISL